MAAGFCPLPLSHEGCVLMRKWLTVAVALALCCCLIISSSLPAAAVLFDDISGWLYSDVVALTWAKDTNGVYNCASSLSSLAHDFILYWTPVSLDTSSIRYDFELLGYICQSYVNSGVFTPDTVASNVSCWFMPFPNSYRRSGFSGTWSVGSEYVIGGPGIYNPYFSKFFTSSFPSGVPVTVTFSVLRSDDSCKYHTNQVQAIKFNRLDDGSGWEYVGCESIHGTYTPEETYGQGNFTIAATFDDIASWDCDAIYFQLLLDGINGGTWHVGLDTVQLVYEPSDSQVMQDQFDQVIDELNKTNQTLNKVYNKLYYMDWSMTDIKNQLEDAIYGSSGVDSSDTDFWYAAGDLVDGMDDVNSAIGAGADLVTGMVSAAPMVTTLTSLGGLLDVFFGDTGQLTICGVTFNPMSAAVIIFGGFSLILLVIAYVFRKRGDS